jgi:PAS domain S-box-containing protein
MPTRSELQDLLQGRRDAIAQRWYKAIATTGFVTLTGPEVRQRLYELAGQAILVFLEEPFQAGKASEIGSALAGLHYLQPEALDRTLGVLGNQLVADLPPDQVGEFTSRLVALLQAISAGFLQQACSMVLMEQEMIRDALVHELRASEGALREAHAHLEMRVERRTAELARANEELRLEIAERRRIEATLRESEEKYRDLVENISDVIYTVDREGRVSYVSPTVEPLLGYHPSELVGRQIQELFYSEDLPRVVENFEGLLAGTSGEGEYRIVSKSGELRCIRTSSRPVVEDSRIVAVHGVLADITERRQAEERLRQSEERWRSLVENAPDYIVTVDRDSRIQFINRMSPESGLSAEEILGADITSMLVPEQQGTVAGAIRNVFETGSSEYCEAAFVRTSGATAWYGGHIGPIWDQGRVVAAILVIRDITERREVDEMKDSLIRDVSHELRTPLAKVQMSLELLSELLEDEEMDRQRASRISSLANLNVQRLLQTVEGILDLSQLDAGVSTSEWEAIQFVEVVREVMGYMDALAEVKGLDLVAQMPEELPMVEGDWEKLFRVLLNLVDNAIKFSEAGRVVVSAKASSEGIEVAVSDSGQGILGENLDRVFERFFQEKTRYQGVGVGLAISKAIVEGHGGRIWAESSGRGQGSTFRFMLPVLADDKGET